MTAEQQLDSSHATEAASPAFLEVQFPVSKLSKESYRERVAVAGQTLTALGKWWGRKPLVLVRAIILGLLLPATNDPEKDRQVFLKLMTMDGEGLWRRFTGIPGTVVYEHLTPREREGWFEVLDGTVRWAKGTSGDAKAAERVSLVKRAFFRMGYDGKLKCCLRPEEVDGPSAEAWTEINSHLGTHATRLADLVQQLGEQRFGHTPRIGDAFCGGGSIPFEAARLGCEAYGSDLNPVAALLTWGALNIVGGCPEVLERIRDAQERVYADAWKQVDEWGIERNEEGWRADAYLYCVEVTDPNSGWRVPLAPSWVIASKVNVVAELVPRPEDKRFDIEILEDVSEDKGRQAKLEGTAKDGVLCPVDRDGKWLAPNRRQSSSLDQIKGIAGLRPWENEEAIPRDGDVFQERLYCIRWVETIENVDGTTSTVRHYRAPTPADMTRDRRVLELLRERFADWQARGYIPSRRIEPGDKTDEPIRTRGWTYWHHLLNPRQLLLNGLFSELAARESGLEAKALLLMLGRLPNWNSRLTTWQVGQGGGIGGGKQTFYNQALNTLCNYSCRTMLTLKSAFCVEFTSSPVAGEHFEGLSDARSIDWCADAWITDPGYADAVNYEELSEFFLAWYEKRLPELFPGWYTDSKRVLAVHGTGETFNTAMVECYKQMARNMSDYGFQVVMFTHQNAEVWADLAMVLWAAGLQVTAAWTIATETEATGIKQGNYVQGTVIMVLRKRRGDLRGDLSDIFPDIQPEVQRQLQSMTALDDKDDPNFGDADYQLAAYAAALRVLTGYSSIGDIDVERELRRTRRPGEQSPLTPLIERAVKIASDFLVPDGLDKTVWKKLGPEERFYLKGVEVESHGEYREGVYQEFARGFGVKEHRNLLGSDTANQVRLRTPREFAARNLGGEGFAGSLLRRVLFGVYTTATQPEMDPRPGRQYMRHEDPDYWGNRQTMIALLRFLANKPKPEGGMPHWKDDAKAAALLLGSVESDSV